MINEIDLKVGKTYPIKRVIEELKKYPEIKLGHIFVLNRHEWHLGVPELEELQKKIDHAEKVSVAAYDISGRKRIEPSDISILSMIDPYSQYKKYEKFYEEFYKQISSAIDGSDSGIVMASSEEVLKEARKEGFVIEKEDDLFDGIYIYFDRRGTESRRIIKGKEGERKEYIVFGREGAITKEEKVDRKTKEEGKSKLVSISEHEARELKEKTTEFEPFYSDLEPTVLAFIKQSKDKSAAVKIDNIMTEAKKTLHNIENRKDLFMRGLIQYFKDNGIAAEILKADNFVIFKMS